MIHAREDYQRFQDPALEDPSLLAAGATPIGASEPVILFRAQDRFFIDILCTYDQLLEGIGIPVEAPIRVKLAEHVNLADEWQLTHGTKIPDV